MKFGAEKSGANFKTGLVNHLGRGIGSMNQVLRGALVRKGAEGCVHSRLDQHEYR